MIATQPNPCPACAMTERETNGPTHLSLCAGIGGIDLGLRRVVRGIRTVAMVEREAFCIAHLVAKMEKGQMDSCPIYPDLHRFPWNNYRGRVDIVSGGVPCQPFSTAGNRKATADPRHLWPVLKSGLAVLKPRVCFLENVDGIATARSYGYHSVLHHVLCDLEQMGFRATAGRFSASELGATHKRMRWFVLAYANRGGRGEDQQHGELRTDGTEQSPCDSGDTGSPATQQVKRWPAGPGQKQCAWEEPRTTEPGLGRSTDGVPSRVDRLRALGNAVVPDVAARAFTTLWQRLGIEHA